MPLCNVVCAICRLQASALHQEDEAMQENNGSAGPATEASFDDAPIAHVDLSCVGPLRLVLQEVVDEGKPDFLAAVLQVLPERPPGPYDPALSMPVR